jgi:hypothetical protein
MNDCCNQQLEGDPYHYQECFLEWTSKLGSNGQLKGAGSSGGPAGVSRKFHWTFPTDL